MRQKRAAIHRWRMRTMDRFKTDACTMCDVERRCDRRTGHQGDSVLRDVCYEGWYFRCTVGPHSYCHLARWILLVPHPQLHHAEGGHDTTRFVAHLGIHRFRQTCFVEGAVLRSMARPRHVTLWSRAECELAMELIVCTLAYASRWLVKELQNISRNSCQPGWHS